MKVMSKNYAYDIKKRVVEKYFEGSTVIKLVEEFDITNRRTIYEWIDKVRTEGYDGLYDTRGTKRVSQEKSKEESKDARINRLELENLYLKKLLDLKRG